MGQFVHPPKLRRWLGHLATIGQKYRRDANRTPKQHSRLQLVLELLEDRTAPALFTVVNTLDSGAGSLRKAIEDANAATEPAEIRFSIPTTDPGFVDVDSGLAGGDAARDVAVIRPTSALPDLNNVNGFSIQLDARTQSTTVGNTNPFGPEVVLDGSLAGAGSNGLVIESNGNEVFGLNIQRFGGHGIFISGGDQNWIAGNFIGTNAAGTAAAANGGHGVQMNGGAQSNLVGTNGDGNSDFAEQNVISGNSLTGLRIAGSGTDGNIVAGNLIGTDRTATFAIGNATHGIRITGGARFTRVGTDGSTANDGAEWNIISGNLSNGVMIDGAATSENSVAGNYIGLSGGGMSAIPNAQGVFLNAGTWGNRIGNVAFAGNIISGNGFNGVVLTGGAIGNVLEGNWIGMDRSGAGDLGNNDDGVHILNAPGNTISFNLISGNNRNGVWLWQSGSSENVVSFNQIGTDISGTLDRGNSGDGVRIENASSNTVTGNTISGNNSDGVEITGSSATSNEVTGNLIGTNGTGTAALGNSQTGVQISGAASNNTIGGTMASARNIISGNKLHGVLIIGAGTSSNIVLGNRIGTNAAGDGSVGNFVNGVQIDNGATNNTIGGSTASARNLISGNGLDGVFIIAASGNRIQGNRIGTNVSGLAALANGRIGILLHPGAAQNVIGTNGDGIGDAGEGNLVSSNLTHGIEIRGAGSNHNIVAGNLVGTDRTGNADLGNSAFGVFIWDGAQNNRVGTDGNGVSDADERNLISGNAFAGVFLSGAGTSGNTVAGNRIGTNLAGTASVDNSAQGVAITSGASNNTIGGSTTAARNLISGNGGNGVDISGSSTTGNVVAGNYIGTDVAGTAALGSALSGVFISAGGNNCIQDNVISGNGDNGIALTSSTSGNLVLGNRIGTDAAGTNSVANLNHGLLISSGAANNRIGTDGNGENDAAEGNIIAFNGSAGVAVSGAATTGNSIRGNSIYANGGLGIDLGDDGITADDVGDSDAGPNDLLNVPEIFAVVPGTYTSIAGAVSSLPNTTITLDFFASATADPSGFGEGQRYLGSITITTDADGYCSFGIIMESATRSGEVITATATDSAGSTSEFSMAVTAEVSTNVLLSVVTNLDASGAFDHGQGKALLPLLKVIQTHIDNGNKDTAIQILNVFGRHVTSLASKGILTQDEAALLLEMVTFLIFELRK